MDSLQDFNTQPLTTITLPFNTINSTPTTMMTATTPPSSSSSSSPSSTPSTLSRYENQKRRDWNTFGQYLRNHRPPLSLARCSGAHVLEFLRYLDQFGKTKVHTQLCPFFGYPNPPAPCPCPLRQAWGSLDALIGRLRAAFEEHGGKPENNPFGARAVRLYLREVRDSQAKARGISYEKKKRKKPQQPQPQQQPQLQLQQQGPALLIQQPPSPATMSTGSMKDHMLLLANHSGIKKGSASDFVRHYICMALSTFCSSK